MTEHSIRCTLQMRFDPKGRSEALQVLRGLLGPLRSHEGCLATQLAQDLRDERCLVWIDEWRTRADFERHVRSEAFGRVLRVMDLATDPPRFEVDAVVRRQGFEVVEQLLGTASAVPPSVESYVREGEK